jgi:uncharacterized Tic20 family protein
MGDPGHEQQEPQLPELTADAKNWGMFCHLAALLGFIPPFLGVIIGPLVVWLIKGKEHPFIDANGKESVNFQISMLIYSAILSVTICIGIGLVLLPILWTIDVVLVIVASVKASNGLVYRYPLTLRLVT